MPTIRATVTQLDHSASRAEVRGHTLTIDRPEAKGGQNKGPMGGEVLLMGFGGCFMSTLLAAALARGISLSGVRAEIEGDLADDAPPRYLAIRMRVSGTCEPAAEFQKLVTIAERGCIVANTLRAAVDLSVELVT
ncbi:MAG: OsmC family protein [Chromatiales bacterium]|nr:OsmC family protein [Chromatiales bacterium]